MAKKAKRLLTSAKLDETQRRVTLRGISPIMFDRYPGDNSTALEIDQKMYFADDGESLVLPSANIMSFLSATNTPSAPKRLIDARKYKATAAAALSYVIIRPLLIPLTRDGEQIRFHGFEDDRDDRGGIEVHRCVARLDKGIPNPKVRPVVRMPWELSFQLSLYANDDISEKMLLMLFTRGGIAVGLGTYRGVYGKFEVAEWE